MTDDTFPLRPMCRDATSNSVGNIEKEIASLTEKLVCARVWLLMCMHNVSICLCGGVDAHQCLNLGVRQVHRVRGLFGPGIVCAGICTCFPRGKGGGGGGLEESIRTHQRDEWR